MYGAHQRQAALAVLALSHLILIQLPRSSDTSYLFKHQLTDKIHDVNPPKDSSDDEPPQTDLLNDGLSRNWWMSLSKSTKAV